MKTYKPERKSLNTLRILIILSAVILSAAFGMFIPFYLPIKITALILGISALFIDFIYLPLFFRSLSYNANDTEIKKSCGVLFRQQESVKYSSIQYSTFITTPFSRLTGLNFIILYVYGGRMIMMFLKREDAMEILENSGCLYHKGE